MNGSAKRGFRGKGAISLRIGGVFILYSDSSLFSPATDLFENQLSLEIRFCLLTNGKIIDGNQNGQALMREQGEQFFDHFSKNDRPFAKLFIRDIRNSGGIVKRRLRQVTKNGYKQVSYRGLFERGQIMLTGYIEESIAGRGESLMKTIRFALNKMKATVLILDKSNRPVYCNSSFVLNWPHAMLSRHPLFNVISEMVPFIRTKRYAERYHASGNRLYQISGIYHGCSQMITFIIKRQKVPKSIMGLLENKHRMESVSQIAAGMAHELRNPLSVIKGFVQLSAFNGQLDKYYDTILSEINRMNDILEDFLSLSRKQTNKKDAVPEKMCRSLIPLIQSECLLKNIDFDYEFESSGAICFVDAAMIKQVILNLLRNAVEAFDDRQKKKRVVLRGKAEEEGYRIILTDNGSGMEKNVLEQLGKPFFTTKAEGTGIGIPLSKKIIAEHQGTFDIDSAPGRGTAITITLPYKPD